MMYKLGLAAVIIGLSGRALSYAGVRLPLSNADFIGIAGGGAVVMLIAKLGQ